MSTTHTLSPRELAVRRAVAEPAAFEPASWQRILHLVRMNPPTLNRGWFDQMSPRQLTNGVIQVTVGPPAHLNFCPGPCQQPCSISSGR